jgi:hypothetical protein
MTTYLPLNVTNNDFRSGKAGTANNNFTASASKSYIFVYMKDSSADAGGDHATIGYDPTNVSAIINSSGGSGTGWVHSTSSFNGNPNSLSHESDTTYNWGSTSDIGSTGISLSGLRTKYINSALIGAADNSGLNSGTANTKFSDFRGSKLLFDGSDVPTGSTAAISIGSVFRNKRFAISSKVGLPADGEHSSYSYLKLTFNSSGGSEIYWTVSSEAAYDFLYIYEQEAGGGGGSSSNATYWLYLHDTGGDGSGGEFALAPTGTTDFLTPTDLGNFAHSNGEAGASALSVESNAAKLNDGGGYDYEDMMLELPLFSYSLPVPSSGSTTVYDLIPYDDGGAGGSTYQLRWGIAKSGGSMLQYNGKGGPENGDLFSDVRSGTATFWGGSGKVIILTLSPDGSGAIGTRDG